MTRHFFPLLLLPAALAQDALEELNPLVIDAEAATALKTDLSPEPAAGPASVTRLEAEEIARLPIVSYGDLFRPIAGVTVNNFGQGGVAYGISLRGFSSGSHTRDVAVYLDGIPLNESGGSPAGYADLNILIPELIDRVDVIRGPVSVRSGNYALGGTGVVRLQGYRNDYGSPGYLDRDLIRSGAISRRSTVDPTGGGDKD